ncbi:MAG: hypothetical protein B7X53_00015 [Hyphomonas sp. 34-62-18]|nr:MAG: hypothetical protein B7X53_00015 [Hyphomonas sp. 34-62-18]
MVGAQHAGAPEQGKGVLRLSRLYARDPAANTDAPFAVRARARIRTGLSLARSGSDRPRLMALRVHSPGPPKMPRRQPGNGLLDAGHGAAQGAFAPKPPQWALA